MVFRTPTKYITDHWQGRQGIGWSFWVNLVLLRAVILLGQEMLAPAKDADYASHSLLVLFLAFLVHGPLFLWQVVGVLRAAEMHIRQHGAMATMWGSQLAVLLAFGFTAIYAFGAWQMTIPVPREESFLVRMDREHASKYSLTTDSGTLAFTGTIELGITQALTKLLGATPGIKIVLLESDGGNIYEARGMAKLIRDNKLETRILDKCSSACTTVFIAGVKRSMKRGARLGFHQYRLDAGYSVPNVDSKREQDRDREWYKQQGVDAQFLSRIFASRTDDMWFPTALELTNANVVHEFID